MFYKKRKKTITENEKGNTGYKNGKPTVRVVNINKQKEEDFWTLVGEVIPTNWLKCSVFTHMNSSSLTEVIHT